MKQLFCCVFFLLAFVLTAVDAVAPCAAFLQGEPLRFTVSVPGKWVLCDWQGKVLQQGEAKAGELLLDALPNGYYALELDETRTFAVVPDPGKRPANREMFFALDSAQSWLGRPDKNPKRPENAFELISEVARRSGTQMVRDRMSWAEVNPAPSKYVWSYYKTNADLLAKRGIAISGMYHDSPMWTRNKKPLLPADMLATYEFAKQVAHDFKGQMTNWEFWNEQDHGFSQESAWDYAAALKAASLGYRLGYPESTVAVGGFAMTPVLPYADAVMKNGIASYFDIFNIHTYRPLRDFSEILRDIRAHLARHGMADYPIWFTENGSGMEGAALLESFMPGVKMHSADQELLLAEYLQKMMITMQFLGVARDFFFVLPPYSENGGNKDWGLMRRDYTVKPGFAAFATLVEKLGDATPEGEIDLGPGVRGFLYRQKDGTQTLVYWSISELDTEPVRPGITGGNLHERPVALPVASGCDIFGTPFTVPPKATRFPAFLDNVNLKVKTPAIAPGKIVRRESSLDQTVIFRTELSEDFTLFVGKDAVDVKQPAARFKLQIWNLSDQPKTGNLTLSGGAFTGLPAAISLPAYGKTELQLTYTPEFDKNFKTELVVNGVFNGKPVSNLTIPVQGLQAMFGAGRKLEITNMNDPGNWRKNASGEMEISYDQAENAISFRTQFPAIQDRWVYPEYTLQLPQEGLADALGVGFEAQVSDPKAVRQMLLMAVPKTGKDLYLRVENPGVEWKEHFVQFPADFNPAEVTRLRIGLNSAVNDVTFMIRNVRFIYKP